MAVTMKRGPKRKPDAERKVPVTIWVKGKYRKNAQKEADKISEKYNKYSYQDAIRLQNIENTLKRD